jgi:hypothetical protein
VSTSQLHQQDLLRYWRAEMANHETLQSLEQIHDPVLPIHARALALSRELDEALQQMVRTPLQAEAGPVSLSAAGWSRYR